MYRQVKILLNIFLFFSVSLQSCTSTSQLKYNIPEKAGLSQGQEFMPEAPEVRELAIMPAMYTLDPRYSTPASLLKPIDSELALTLHSFTASSGATVTFLQENKNWKAKVQDYWPGTNLGNMLSHTSILSVFWINADSSPVTLLPILARQPAKVHKQRIHIVQDTHSKRIFLGAFGLLGGVLDEKESKQARTSLSLYEAAGQGNIEVVKQFLKRGDNPNTGYLGVTPLYIAAKRGYVDIVQVLLANGADVHIPDRDGYTPLHMAAMYGHLEVVTLLLALGADLYSVNQYGDSALHAVAESGHCSIIQLLLNRKADPNSTNQSEDTPLHWAARNGHLEAVQLLLQYGADPNKASIDGTTPLHEAARKGYTKVVTLLLKSTLNPNICNQDGDTPLYWAAENGHLELVQLLLQYGADPNKSNIHGYNPLYRAVENGHLNIVQLLLDKQAEPNSADKFGCCPLHLAAEQGKLEVVRLLLQKNADPNRVNRADVSPLHNAASKGYEKIVQLLLEKRADPNKSDINGNTPLHLAADVGSLAVINILLKAGAEKNAQNKHGDSFMHKLLAKHLNLCLPSIKIIESDHAGLLRILTSYINRHDSNLVDIRDNLPIIVDYVKGLDCSLKNQQGKTIEELLMHEKEKITSQTLEEICKKLERHKQPGRWNTKATHTTIP